MSATELYIDTYIFLREVVSEDILENISLQTNDINVLRIILALKAESDLNGSNVKTNLVDNNFNNTAKLFDILNLAMIYANDLKYNLLLSFVRKTIEKYKNKSNDIVKFLQLLVNWTNSSERKTLFLKELPIKKIKVYLGCDVKSNSSYLHLSILHTLLDMFEDESFCEVVWEHIEVEQNLLTLCNLMDHFLSISCNMRLLQKERFWKLLQESIIATESQKNKLSLYVLKRAIDHISLLRKDFQTQEYTISWEANNSANFNCIWQNFFILIEISREKQLHLVEPCLPLLNNIQILHPSWLFCIYSILMNHVQSKVIIFTSNHLMTNEWALQDEGIFNKSLNCFINALNKNFSTEMVQVCSSLNKFTLTLNELQFVELINQCVSVNWVPGALWHFLLNVLNNRHHSLALPGVIKLLVHIKNLPHIFIRYGCIGLLLTYVQKCSEKLDIKEYITLLIHYFKDENLFRYILQFSPYDKSNLLLHFSNETKSWKFGVFSSIDYIVVYLELIKNCNFKGTARLQVNETLRCCFNSTLNLEVKDILLYYTCDTLIENEETDELLSYIHNRLQHVTFSEDIKWLIATLEKFVNVLTNKCTKTILISNLKENSKSILLEDNLNLKQITLALTIYEKLGSYGKLKIIINTWKLKFFQMNNKMDVPFWKKLYSLYIEEFKVSKDVIMDQEFYDITTNLLNTESEDLCCFLIDYIPLLYNTFKFSPAFVDLIQKFCEQIIQMKRTLQLKEVINKFLFVFLRTLSEESSYYKTTIIRVFNQILSISESWMYGKIALAVAIKKEFLNLSKDVQKLLIPVTVDLLLSCNGFRKCDRLEYETCRCITQTDLIIPSDISPFNYELDVKLSVIKTIINLEHSVDCEELANLYVICLLEKYEASSNKRYFPESQILIQKTRIMQAFLILNNLIGANQKEALIQFILNCIEMESHQVCVMQLMQLLLIDLVKDSSHWCNVIFEKVASIPLQSQASSQTALISILYHLCKNQEESFMNRVISCLLKFSMGPTFKLRLYSQLTLLRISEYLFKEDRHLSLQYSQVFITIKNVLGDCKKEIEKTIHRNLIFYDTEFNALLTLETILVYIPKLNNVPESEWKIQELFIEMEKYRGKQILNFCSEDLKLKDFVNSYWNFTKISSNEETVIYGDVQKKLQPTLPISKTGAQSDLIVVTSLINNLSNIGGLARTCEIYNVKMLVVPNKQIVTEKEFTSLSMSSEGWLNIFEVKYEKLNQYLLGMKKEGYSVVGVEQTVNSDKLDKFQFPKKTILLLGNEKEGICPKLMPTTDVCVEISQLGMTRSLNVHVAGAIFIWEYSKQHLLS